MALDPTEASFGAGGGDGQVAVDLIGCSECTWSASSNPDWITITDNGTGAGDGAVFYSVAETASSGERTGVLTIRGEPVAVTQAGGVCTFTLDSSSASYGASGGGGQIAVDAAYGDCAWSASSNDFWITITDGGPFAGDGTVSYRAASSNHFPRTGSITVAGEAFTIYQKGLPQSPQAAAGSYHTVGLRDDGVLRATGSDSAGQCGVDAWTGVVQAAAGQLHTVGLLSDGSVTAVGRNSEGQCNVGSWSGVVQIAAGQMHTVGLSSDGSVAATGGNIAGECDVTGWSGIVHIAAGGYHTVGVNVDGSASAVGWNEDGQCDVGAWSDIVEAAAGLRHTVGLRSDGAVVAVGDNTYGQCNVGGWTDIEQTAAGAYHTVGLRFDGTVVAVGDDYCGQCDVSSWTDVVYVAAGDYHTVGVQSDGGVLAVGCGPGGQCDVSGWDLAVLGLNVSVTGNGGVTSTDNNIDCPNGTCSQNYDYGDTVRLEAMAGTGYSFDSWTGCDSPNGAQCDVTVDGAENVIAAFTVNQYDLSVSVTGNGGVTSTDNNIDCPADCSATFTHGQFVTLTANAGEGSKFTGWSGPCSGTGDCTVTMDQAQIITAAFAPSHAIPTLSEWGLIAMAFLFFGVVFFKFRRQGFSGFPAA
jgi:hypothetical protein